VTDPITRAREALNIAVARLEEDGCDCGDSEPCALCVATSAHAALAGRVVERWELPSASIAYWTERRDVAYGWCEEGHEVRRVLVLIPEEPQ